MTIRQRHLMLAAPAGTGYPKRHPLMNLAEINKAGQIVCSLLGPAVAGFQPSMALAAEQPESARQGSARLGAGSVMGTPECGRPAQGGAEGGEGDPAAPPAGAGDPGPPGRTPRPT